MNLKHLIPIASLLMGLSAHVFGETCYFNSSDGYPAGDPAKPNPAPGEVIKIQATLNQPDWNYQIGERYDPFHGNWMTRTQLSVTLPDQINRGKDYNHSFSEKPLPREPNTSIPVATFSTGSARVHGNTAMSPGRKAQSSTTWAVIPASNFGGSCVGL